MVISCLLVVKERRRGWRSFSQFAMVGAYSQAFCGRNDLIGRFSIGFSDDLFVCIDAIFECDPAVFSATHGGEDSSSIFGRDPFGLEYLHGIFPGGVIGRLFLCPLAHEKQNF